MWVQKGKYMQKKPPRNIRVEALRIIAIVGIAIFHTFIPWFNKLMYMIPSAAHVKGIENSQLALWFLGCVSLLGAMGNFIFYMISGYFLLPRIKNAAQRAFLPHTVRSHYSQSSVEGGSSLRPISSAGDTGDTQNSAIANNAIANNNGAIGITAVDTPANYWKTQFYNTAKRALIIVVSVIFYAIISLVLHFAFNLPGPSLTSARWIIGGLEFVWLYLIFVLLAPLCAWVWAHWRSWPIFIIIFFIIVMAVGVWVGFFSHGDLSRPLESWRKWLSAIAYFAAFLFAGVLGNNSSAYSKWGSTILWIFIIASLVCEGYAAFTYDVALIGNLSFKSTSLLSIGLAIGALLTAVHQKSSNKLNKLKTNQKNGNEISIPSEKKIHTPVRLFAGGILGFYIFQSMLHQWWESVSIPFLNKLLYFKATLPASLVPSSSSSVSFKKIQELQDLLGGIVPHLSIGGVCLFAGVGIVITLLYTAGIVLWDIMTRRYIVKKIS